MSVTITGMNALAMAGDTGFPMQAIVGGLVIEPPTSGAGSGGAVPAQVQIGPLAINTLTTKTAAYTIGATDTAVVFNGSASVTTTLPSAASFPGRVLLFSNIANFTVISASSNVIPAGGGAAGTALLAATGGSGNKWAVLVSNGTSWQIMAAN